MLAATKSPLFIVLPPDLGEQAAEIATEHGPYVTVRIVAANDFFGEFEGLQWMVETIDVVLVAKGVAALVAALEQRIFVRLHIVIAVKVGVGADADMVDADELCDMVDMVGHMPDVGGIGRPHEHTHPGDAHHPALRRECLDRRVGLDARMVDARSEEHTSELQSLMRHSYAVFCLKK